MVRNGKKGIVSVALMFGALAGCTQVSDEYYSVMGVNRTTPAESNINFNNRHTPVLNSTIPTDDSTAPRDVYSPQGSIAVPQNTNVASGVRRVPVENNNFASNAMPPSIEPMPMTTATIAPAVPVSTMNLPAPTMASNQQLRLTPPAGPSDAESLQAATPIVKTEMTSDAAPVVTSTPAIKTEVIHLTPPPADTADAAAPSGDSAYPKLADVPPMPNYPAKEQSISDMKSLASDHNSSEASREQLMNDPNATVMTSPQTGQLVDNPAQVVASQAVPPAPAPAPQAQDKGFNNWLHGLFPADQQGNPVHQAAAPASVAAPHELASAPDAVPTPPMGSSLTVPPSMDMPAPATASIEPMPAAAPETVHLSAPVVAVPAMTADIAPAPAQAAFEPVHLHAPVASADESGDASSSHELVQPENAETAAAPISLTPPTTLTPTRYLSDSRYAARRIGAQADDDQSNND